MAVAAAPAPLVMTRIDQPGQRDDRRAVLVVVEDRDIALFLQLPLDFKAPRRGDILQVHAAEAAGEQVDRVHDLVDILALDAQRERVHVAERLEQHALAFHDRHAGLGPDIAQAQHRRAVGHHGAHVPAAGQVVALLHVLLDLQARLSHARRVRQRKVVLRLHRHLRDHFDLALPFAVQAQRFLRIIHETTILLVFSFFLFQASGNRPAEAYSLRAASKNPVSANDGHSQGPILPGFPK